MTYSYICRKCEQVKDFFYRMGKNPDKIRCGCGGWARRLFKPHQVAEFRPYVTTDISGKPEFVDSRSTQRRLMREHGVERLTTEDTKRIRRQNRRPNADPESIRRDWLATQQELGVKVLE